MHKMTIENITKAQDSAAFLVDELQQTLKTCSALESLLILPEIERAANMSNKLNAILDAIKRNYNSDVITD